MEETLRVSLITGRRIKSVFIVYAADGLSILLDQNRFKG
jgi:hypothetical protein